MRTAFFVSRLGARPRLLTGISEISSVYVYERARKGGPENGWNCSSNFWNICSKLLNFSINPRGINETRLSVDTSLFSFKDLCTRRRKSELGFFFGTGILKTIRATGDDTRVGDYKAEFKCFEYTFNAWKCYVHIKFDIAENKIFCNTSDEFYELH